MNRIFYILAIFFVGLYTAVALFQSLLVSWSGPQVFLREAILPWFFLASTIYVVELIFILKYYYNKEYWFAFSSLFIVALISLGHSFNVYNLLVTKELGAYYIVTYFILLAASVLYSLSLIFSKAAERPWLKKVGMIAVVLQLILLSMLILRLNLHSIQMLTAMASIYQWTAFVLDLLAILYIANFLSELKTVEIEQGNSELQLYWKGILGVIVVTASVPTLIFGINVSSPPLRINQNKITDNARWLAQSFEAHTYVNSDGDTLPYRMMKPLDYDSTKKYPLVVCLHHGGAHGTDNIMQVEGSGAAQLLSTNENRVEYRAFLFVPQCPVDSNWATIDSLVFETIRSLEQEYKIDEKRRYVMGTSGGGFGSWHFICTRPKMFAAAIPICGACSPELAPNIVNVAVWAFHGAKDSRVPVEYSRDMIEAIKKAGGHPRYTEFPEAGHNISEQVNETPGLMDWLFAQKRD